MKTALLLSSLYYPNVGGVENSIGEIAKVLVENGYRVLIVCSDRDYVSGSTLQGYSDCGPIEIYRYHYPKGTLGTIKQYASCTRLLFRLSRVNFDLVLARAHMPLICARLVGINKIKYLVPSVCLYQEKWLKWPGLRALASKVYNALLQTVALWASDVFVFSDSVALQVSRASLGLSCTRLVKPGMDRMKFSPLAPDERAQIRASLGLGEDDIVLLGLGRFVELKQFSLLIECMPHLPDRFKLLLVGEGPEKEAYEANIKELRLEGRVFVLGATDKPAMFYQASDVFCMTSRYEAFGQVLLEATSAGLPVAAFSTAAGVNTAVEKIYEKHPSLVSFAHNADHVSFARAVVDALEKACSDKFIASCRVFSKQYSWEKLVYDLS